MKPSPRKHRFETQLAIDVVLLSIVDDRLCALLITRQWEPFAHVPSLPGAFLRPNETTLVAAKRILREKAGITSNVYMEQLYTFDTTGRDPRGNFPTVTYMTLVPQGTIMFGDLAHAQTPQWVPVTKLPTLAFDHAIIICAALRRLRAKLEYTNTIYSLLPRQFTLTQLQSVYEIVMAKNMDKRNFRKKYLSLGLIRSTGRISRGGQRRPAVLYEFKKHRLTELKKFLG